MKTVSVVINIVFALQEDESCLKRGTEDLQVTYCLADNVASFSYVISSRIFVVFVAASFAKLLRSPA